MKKSIIITGLLACIACTVKAQSDDQKTISTIRQSDSLFWLAYNKCDVPGMMKWISDDIEFYHDKGGPTFGFQNMMGAIRQGLCGNDSFRLRRAPVEGTVRIYVLHKDGTKVYGAVISGQHVFYVNQLGKPEFLDGLARFTHTWILKDGAWKMTRILSYDHGPAGRKMD